MIRVVWIVLLCLIPCGCKGIMEQPQKEYVKADVAFANAIVPYVTLKIAGDTVISDLDRKALTLAVNNWLFMVRKGMEVNDIPELSLYAKEIE